MLSRLRNLLLPPPGILLCLGALGLFAASGAEDVSETNAGPIVVSAPKDRDNATPGIQLPDRSVSSGELQSISVNTLFLEARAPWQVPESPRPEEVQPVDPAPLPEPTAVAPKLPVPDLTLSGMVNNNATFRALVRDNETGIEHWLSVGDLHNHWQVKEIAEDRIILRAEGEEIVVLYNR